MNRLLMGLVGVVACLGASAGQDAPLKLESQADKINYSVGFRVGSDLTEEGEALSPELLVKGIQDAVSGGQPLMTQDEMHTALRGFQQKVSAREEEERAKSLAPLVAEDKAFLAANAKKEGVVTLPSGLQYKVIESGKGKSVTAADTVTVDYQGTLIDGTEFDSSYKRGEPATFAVKGAIPGWTEALQRMREGDHWQLFIPPELAYGEQGRLAGRALIFDVKLLKVQSGKVGTGSSQATEEGEKGEQTKPTSGQN
jgi:FKBP-type peptidyl-prolyl cis-trans isomerase FklB